MYFFVFLAFQVFQVFWVYRVYWVPGSRYLVPGNQVPGLARRVCGRPNGQTGVQASGRLGVLVGGLAIRWLSAGRT